MGEEKKEKIQLLRQLILMAEADYKLRISEYDFILNVAKSMNISQDEVDVLFAEDIKIRPPTSELERITQFMRLVLLMNVDKEVNQLELDLLNQLSLTLGLSPFATEKVLWEMASYPNNQIHF